jgi:hypothetical protein
MNPEQNVLGRTWRKIMSSSSTSKTNDKMTAKSGALAKRAAEARTEVRDAKQRVRLAKVAHKRARKALKDAKRSAKLAKAQADKLAKEFKQAAKRDDDAKKAAAEKDKVKKAKAKKDKSKTKASGKGNSKGLPVAVTKKKSKKKTKSKPKLSKPSKAQPVKAQAAKAKSGSASKKLVKRKKAAKVEPKVAAVTTEPAPKRRRVTKPSKPVASIQESDRKSPLQPTATSQVESDLEKLADELESTDEIDSQ